MNTATGIRISQEGLGHALSDNSFVVPMYQRSYAWDDDHVTDLFEDLANAIRTDEPEYFLGSIVSARVNGGKEIVDGQQRLATTTILLSAIRDYFLREDDTQRARVLEHEYLMHEDIKTLEIHPKLTLNEYDNDYFIKRVLTKPDERDVGAASRVSHKKIDRAFRLASQHVRAVVKPYSPEEAINVLLSWVEYIRDRARVIWVEVPDEANAFVIFETLNDRGLDLSIADLLKNFIFGKADDRIEEAQQRWASMIGSLETVTNKDITVTYIRHLWASTHGPTRERDLYANIRASLKSKQSTIDFANLLSDDAVQYAALLNPEHEIWNAYGSSARKHIGILRQLRMEQVRPLLLAALKKLPFGEVKKVMKYVVCASVRFLVVGGLGGGTMEKHYSLRAVDIRDEQVTTAKELARAMEGVVPNDALFEAAFKTASVSQAYLARYYLRALELQVKDDPEPELVPNTEEDVVNLEHVLPLSPSEHWADFPEDDVDAYKKRIGNMVLLKAHANANLGNTSFADKVAVLSQSGFYLTKEVSNESAWSPETIDARQRRLAEVAVRTWPIKT